MRRLILLLATTASLSSCFEWKGNGTDEVLPDVVGMASDHKIPPAFGVPSQSLGERADVNIKENRGERAEPGEHEAHPGEPPHAGGPVPPPPPKGE